MDNGIHLQEQGQYPVIFLSLKSLSAKSFEGFVSRFTGLIANIYTQFLYLMESSESAISTRIHKFINIQQEEASQRDLEESLSFLMSLLQAYHQKPVYVLIDEYDNHNKVPRSLHTYNLPNL